MSINMYDAPEGMIAEGVIAEGVVSSQGLTCCDGCFYISSPLWDRVCRLPSCYGSLRPDGEVVIFTPALRGIPGPEAAR